MRVTIDMPIFSSPSRAWGCIQGEVEIASLPLDGSLLHLPLQSAELMGLGLPNPMMVKAVVAHAHGTTTVMLDGVVADGTEAATRIATILEEQFGFFLLWEESDF
jgi:hypothetical protein